jgi:hypothetical protein
MPDRRILGLAVLAYGVAWVLPSLSSDGFFANYTYRGWEATLAAFQSVTARWPWGLLAFLSGLSNLLFVAAAGLQVWRPKRVGRRLERAVWAAALVNTHWLVLGTVNRRELGAGYYLWVCSFALLACALHAARREAIHRATA